MIRAILLLIAIFGIGVLVVGQITAKGTAYNHHQEMVQTLTLMGDTDRAEFDYLRDAVGECWGRVPESPQN